MRFLIHLIAESKVSQHVQEIACLERKEHRLEDVGLTLRRPRSCLGQSSREWSSSKWRNTWKLNVVARTVAEPEG